MRKTVALHNLGCKVNSYELEAMAQLLTEAGYETVPFEPGADVYVINTCTVTNIADRKSRQMLHKARKMNPDAIVVAVGCYVQTDEGKLKVDDAVDIILGNNQKQYIVQILEAYEESHQKEIRIEDLSRPSEYERLSISGTEEHVRAFLKVQDGCNQFCSYCIIPFARGRVRSRTSEDVLKEVEVLAAAGYKEVVLTGIHLSSYGVDLEGEENLLSLIRKVHSVEGITRIRLGSLEPRLITEDFARELSSLWKVCPHFHLSLQSGCTETLKRMNRRYTAEEYAQNCEILRRFYADPALCTDVIVGFPQETEEEFAASRDFVDAIRFYETHIFKYSIRHGTRAAGMSGQLTDAQKSVRSDVLEELNARHMAEYEERRLGQPLSVLLEEEVILNGQAYLIGHSREYVQVAVRKDEGYQVNDEITVIPDRFLEPHILTRG